MFREMLKGSLLRFLRARRGGGVHYNMLSPWAGLRQAMHQRQDGHKRVFEFNPRIPQYKTNYMFPCAGCRHSATAGVGGAEAGGNGPARCGEYG